MKQHMKFALALLTMSLLMPTANATAEHDITKDAASQNELPEIVLNRGNDLLDRLDVLAGIEDFKIDKSLIEGLETPVITGQTKATFDAMKQHYQSPAFKQNVEEWQGRVAKSMGVKGWKSSDELSINQVVPFSDKPVLFISSSIPLHVLNRYARDLERIGGVMVLKGGVEGLHKLMPTLRFIANVLKKDPACTQEPCEKYRVNITIDPVLFTAYHITRVPAFAVHGKENFTAYCNQTQALNKGSRVSLGDFSIKYHLSEVQESSEYESLIEAL